MFLSNCVWRYAFVFILILDLWEISVIEYVDLFAEAYNSLIFQTSNVLIFFILKFVCFKSERFTISHLSI